MHRGGANQLFKLRRHDTGEIDGARDCKHNELDFPALCGFRGGVFEPYVPAEMPPRATSSVDWYRGCRDHLEFCQIANSAESAGRSEPHGPGWQTAGAADA